RQAQVEPVPLDLVNAEDGPSVLVGRLVPEVNCRRISLRVREIGPVVADLALAAKQEPLAVGGEYVALWAEALALRPRPPRVARVDALGLPLADDVRLLRRLLQCGRGERQGGPKEQCWCHRRAHLSPSSSRGGST